MLEYLLELFSLPDFCVVALLLSLDCDVLSHLVEKGLTETKGEQRLGETDMQRVDFKASRPPCSLSI